MFFPLINKNAISHLNVIGQQIGPVPVEQMPHFNTPYSLHIFGEFGASYGFFVSPSSTLAQPQPYAHAVLRNYALLLTSTNLIAANFLFQERPSSLSCRTAGALALYHLGPLMRAALKIRNGERMGTWKGMGGAWVHVIFHSVTLAALGWEATKLSWLA